MREEVVERVVNLMSEIQQREEEDLNKLSETPGSGEEDDLELSKEEEGQLDELDKKLNASLYRIVQHLALEYDYGDIAALDDGKLRELVENAKEATDNWRYEAGIQTPPVKPKTPLQKLLAEHADFGDQILGIETVALERDIKAHPGKYPIEDYGETE